MNQEDARREAIHTEKEKPNPALMLPYTKFFNIPRQTPQSQSTLRHQNPRLPKQPPQHPSDTPPPS